MFTDFQTPMFCLRHPQNKTKATQREIQTNHSFWKEEKARKNPWMSKFPRQSHYSYDSLHHVTATYFEPKDDGVQDEFFLGVMAVSAFFSGMSPFGSPSRNVMWLHVLRAFFIRKQLFHLTFQLGWELQRSWHEWSFMVFSWELRNFSIEKTHCASLSHRFYGYDGLWVSVLMESKGTPWFENVVHYSYHPCISCTCFHETRTKCTYVHVAWMIWMAIGAFQEPAWYSSKRDLPQVWLWGFGLTCKTCSKMFDFGRQKVYVNM